MIEFPHYSDEQRQAMKAMLKATHHYAQLTGCPLGESALQWAVDEFRREAARLSKRAK